MSETITPSGWHVCPTCRAYIPDGAQHLCPGPAYTAYTWSPAWIDQETKDLLKRIADALEKIVESTK